MMMMLMVVRSFTEKPTEQKTRNYCSWRLKSSSLTSRGEGKKKQTNHSVGKCAVRQLQRGIMNLATTVKASVLCSEWNSNGGLYFISYNLTSEDPPFFFMPHLPLLRCFPRNPPVRLVLSISVSISGGVTVCLQVVLFCCCLAWKRFQAVSVIVVLFVGLTRLPSIAPCYLVVLYLTCPL